MSIFQGGNAIQDLRLGSDIVHEVWRGGSRVWSAVDVQSASVIDIKSAPTTPFAQFRMDRNAFAWGDSSDPSEQLFRWLHRYPDTVPSPALSDYQVRAQLVSGSVSSGDPVNTWLTFASTRAWRCDLGAEANLDIELRAGSEPQIRATARVILRAARPL